MAYRNQVNLFRWGTVATIPVWFASRKLAFFRSFHYDLKAMAVLSLNPTDCKDTAYYEPFAEFDRLGVTHKTAVRSNLSVIFRTYSFEVSTDRRVIDQFEVPTDRSSAIESEPNCSNDKQYIVRLIGHVITVQRIIASLPGRSLQMPV